MNRADEIYKMRFHGGPEKGPLAHPEKHEDGGGGNKGESSKRSAVGKRGKTVTADSTLGEVTSVPIKSGGSEFDLIIKPKGKGNVSVHIGGKGMSPVRLIGITSKKGTIKDIIKRINDTSQNPGTGKKRPTISLDFMRVPYYEDKEK